MITKYQYLMRLDLQVALPHPQLLNTILQLKFQPLFLNWDCFYHPGDIEQCLKTFLVSQLRGSATGLEWVEARDADKHPSIHKAAPQRGTVWAQVSLVRK